MCGFAGALAIAAPPGLDRVVQRMADRLQHRGPDDSGVWVDEAAGIGLGHRRLSILDLSPAGHQPMLSACGRYVIAFNGEIYNHLSLRDALGHAGAAPAWRGHSDTETLLAGFAAWGLERTLQQAVGMFAFALWDRETRRLTLARDRMGEKPLYYGWQGDHFLFGSELKALRVHPAFRAEIDRGALALLLRYNYVPAPHSIYAGIHKLPAGSHLQLGAGQRDAGPTSWWSLAEVAARGFASPFPGTDADAQAVLEEKLGAAVRGQMVADVPLGALLSGGLDSTLITALMQANSPQPVRTFTIGFAERRFDEAAHARAVAAHLGTDHTELRLSSDDALALVPQLPTFYDEPFADSSQLPTYLVMRLARQHVTVALSGDAGDELFGGYTRYVHAPQLWRRMGWWPPFLRHALGAGLTTLTTDSFNRLIEPAARQLGVAHAGDKAHKLGLRLRSVDSLDGLYQSLVSEWPEAERLVVGGLIPPTFLGNPERWPQVADPAARMMLLDGLTYLPDDILVKVDRAAMAVSLETRVPYLDRDVIDFAWSLPMRMKVRGWQSKWLLRRLLDRHVPRDLLDRPKFGFGVPLDEWLRGPLRDWAEGLLSEQRLRQDGLLDVGIVRKAWHQHLTGRYSLGYRLWSVLMFQAWLEDQAAAR